MEVGFVDQCVDSNVEPIEKLAYVADMDVDSVDSLVVDVVEDLHDTIDLCVLDVDLLVDFMFEDIVVAGCDQ